MLTSYIKAFFVWMRRLVADLFPLTLSLSRKGRGNPRTASSYKCKPLYIPHSTLRIPHSARTPPLLYTFTSKTHTASASVARRTIASTFHGPEVRVNPPADP